MTEKKRKKPLKKSGAAEASVAVPGRGYAVSAVFNKFSLSRVDGYLILEVGFVEPDSGSRRSPRVWSQFAFVSNIDYVREFVQGLEGYLASIDQVEPDYDASDSSLPSVDYEVIRPFNRITASHGGNKGEIVFLNIAATYAAHKLNPGTNSSGEEVLIDAEGVALLSSHIAVQKALFLEFKDNVDAADKK